MATPGSKRRTIRRPTVCRPLAAAVVLTLMVLSGCSRGTKQGATVPGVTASPPAAAAVAPASTLVGPSATNPAPVLAATMRAWNSMVSTIYAHKYDENAKTGVYRFDCVGATSYFLGIASPRANTALNTTEHIGRGYVPTPSRYAAFFTALPAAGTAAWMPVGSPADLVGGEIIAVPPPSSDGNPIGASIPGHALITAGPALALDDGGYAVLVYDSTGTPHGAEDTRLTDPRNQPLPPSKAGGSARPSGLGRGTVELRQMPDRPGWFLFWSVAGNHPYGGAVAMARPLA